MTQQTILIIEDEQDIRELLIFNLEKEGFATLSSGNGKEGRDLAKTKLPDLILLDLMLPGLDGLSVCRELERSQHTAHIPIIMLTAKGEEVDRVVGLELGASDYIVKPFSMRELLLRIRNILKRQGVAGTEDSLARHGVRLDPGSHRATVDSVNIDLTATEFRLLENLMRDAGQVRTREQLLDGVWGYRFEGYARTVDTHMRRLRGKLGPVAEVLETVRGVGYRFKE